MGGEHGKSQISNGKQNLNSVNFAHLYSQIKRMRTEKTNKKSEQAINQSNFANLIEHINVEAGVKLIYNGKPVHHLANKAGKKESKRLALTKTKLAEMYAE